MATIAQVRQAIYNWAKKELAIEVIWSEQAEIRPDRPYVMLKLITGPLRGGHDEIRQPTPGTYKVCGMRGITVSVNVFGEKALELAAQLQTSLEKITVQEALRSAGLSFIRAEAVTDLTVLMETRFDTRANLDAMFAYAENVDDNVGTIEHVAVKNLITGESTVVN